MSKKNFMKKIVEKNITEDVHNVFVRYSLGDFEREPFTIKAGAKDYTIKTGFEYLNFLHTFLAENIKGDVEVSGTIESIRNIAPSLEKLGLEFEEKRRFGKSGSKFVLSPQTIPTEQYKKLITDLFSEYLLLNIKFAGGLLKVKSQNTPKLGSPTVDFVVIKLPREMWKEFKDDYLFDVKAEGKEIRVNHIYSVKDIVVDEKLLAKDAERARREAVRKGVIKRKVTVDGKVVEEKEITFEA